MSLTIALVTAHLSDASGGFVGAVSGMARSLAARFTDQFHIVGIKDAQSPDGWRRWGCSVHPARELGPRAFGWAPGIDVSLRELAPDLWDAQGLWMYPSLASLKHGRRTGRPFVVTPHGMLDSWALQQSRWKKSLIARLFETDHLGHAACLRALNQDEAKAFRAYRLKNPIAIVPNGIDLPRDTAPSDRSSRTILFLGRIDAKKGVAELLHAWQRVVADPTGADWRLQVTGWGDPAYVTSMQRLATELQIEPGVTFTGPLFGEDKATAFRDAAAFILPSYSEGLPMAVLEAWSFGLPVLMTRMCNLPEGFSTSAAQAVTTKPDEMARSLLAFMTTQEGDRRAMGEAGRRLVEERFTWDRVAAEMHEVYTWVLGGGPPPACVVTD